MSEIEMTFDMPLTVRIDVDTGELRFELGEVTEPAAPTLIELEGQIAVAEGPLDQEDKAVVNDPRVLQAFALLAGRAEGEDPPWDWADGVVEAANEGLATFVKQRPG